MQQPTDQPQPPRASRPHATISNPTQRLQIRTPPADSFLEFPRRAVLHHPPFPPLHRSTASPDLHPPPFSRAGRRLGRSDPACIARHRLGRSQRSPVHLPPRVGPPTPSRTLTIRSHSLFLRFSAQGPAAVSVRARVERPDPGRPTSKGRGYSVYQQQTPQPSGSDSNPFEATEFDPRGCHPFANSITALLTARAHMSSSQQQPLPRQPPLSASAPRSRMSSTWARPAPTTISDGSDEYDYSLYFRLCFQARLTGTSKDHAKDFVETGDDGPDADDDDV